MNDQRPRDAAGVTGGMRAPLVVVLDEDDDARRIIETWLRVNGVGVLAASDASTAADALAGRTADVLVSELRGRGAFAPPLARAARAHPAFRDVPLVIHTSRVGIPDREDAAECGAREFLTKPANLRALLAAVLRAADAAPGATPDEHPDDGSDDGSDDGLRRPHRSAILRRWHRPLEGWPNG